MVGRARVELATSRLSGVRSNHLSYRPRTQQSPNLPIGSRGRQKPAQAHNKAQALLISRMKGHEDDGMFCGTDEALPLLPYQSRSKAALSAISLERR